MKWKGVGLLVGLFQALPVFGSLFDGMAFGLPYGFVGGDPRPLVNTLDMQAHIHDSVPVTFFSSEEALPHLPAPLVSDPLEIVKGPLYQLEDKRWLLRLLRKKNQYFIQLELKPPRAQEEAKRGIKSISTIVYDEGETFTLWLPEKLKPGRSFQMDICLAANGLMESLIREYLRIYFGDVEDYTVSQEMDGSIHISVWKKGEWTHLTLEKLLMKLGEWHYFFFEVYLQGRYGRRHCTSVYIPGSTSAEYVPVYSPAKKKIKGDSSVHSEEVTDGNKASRSDKKTASPDGGYPEPDDSKGKVEEKPEEDGIPSGPDNFEKFSESPEKEEKAAKPEASRDTTRFRVMRAMNDLVLKKQLQQGRGRGVLKLAEYINSENEAALRQQFKPVSSQPDAPLPVFLADILVQGYTAQIATFLVRHLDSAVLNRFKQELNQILHQRTVREVRVRQTQIRRMRNNDEYQLVVSILEELGQTRNADQPSCTLPLLDEKGWDIVLSRGKNEVVYHHQQHRSVIKESKPELTSEELSQRMVQDLLANLELYFDDKELMEEVLKEVCFVVPVDIDSEVREKMQSQGLNQGILEQALGLGDHVRIEGHPNIFAGTVRLSAKPKKHVEILLRESYVEIRVSMEFSSAVVTRPDKKEFTLRMQLGVRNHYRFLTDTYDLTTDRSEVVLSPPQLPPPPTAEEKEAWRQTALQNDQDTIQSGLATSKKFLETYIRQFGEKADDRLGSLHEPSRSLKVAWQKMKNLWGRATEWQSSKEELNEQLSKLQKETASYLESVRAALRNTEKPQEESHPLGSEVIDMYQRLVEQSIEHLEAMQRLTEQLRSAQAGQEALNREIKELEKSHEALGDTYRYDGRSELPVARAQRMNEGAMTEEQKTMTSHLSDIYYVMTSSFTVEKQVLQDALAASEYQEERDEDDSHPEASVSHTSSGSNTPSLPFRIIDEGDDDEDSSGAPDDLTPGSSQ
ncbi:hypothetical protein [Endozoicomonas arenosclerae]|uniref:hypothetical protein n=1 Tax=Endozoicomonas arenosclerae TaxID=1633495 RepID=UPI0007846DD3|nr:hypothetical protein [Endozoicomonas arenosclerae]